MEYGTLQFTSPRLASEEAAPLPGMRGPPAGRFADHGEGPPGVRQPRVSKHGRGALPVNKNAVSPITLSASLMGAMAARLAILAQPTTTQLAFRKRASVSPSLPARVPRTTLFCSISVPLSVCLGFVSFPQFSTGFPPLPLHPCE